MPKYTRKEIIEARLKQAMLEQHKRDVQRARFYRTIIVAVSLIIIGLAVFSYVRENQPLGTPATHHYQINK